MPDLTPDQMAKIHAACFTSPRPWSAAEITGLLDSPHCFVCSVAEGFALGRAVAGEAELLTLAVTPTAQGRGVGAGLIDLFFDAARRRRSEQAFLEVAAHNLAAIHLYGKKGFHLSGQRPGYYHLPGGGAIAALILSRML